MLPGAAICRVPVALAALVVALIIYGLFGFPTPPSFGPAELAVGVLIACAAGPPAIATIIRPTGPSWMTARLLFLYGLTVPVLAGLLNGADPALMLRDIIPFLFLLLPLFLGAPPARLDAGQRRILTGAVAASGLCFAARVVAPWLSRAGGGWRTGQIFDPDYLANAPTVLFTALLLLGLAAREIWRGPSPRRIALAAMAGLAALLPVTATMLVTQRASAGALAVFAAGGLVFAVLRSPRRAWPLLLTAGMLVAWRFGEIMLVVQGLLAKTQEVGVNMRGQEALAVARALEPSPLGVLFGRGWGATVASPAVGGLTVNYTHSFLTTYWLKTGLCGMALAIAYLAGMARRLLRFPARDGLFAAALALPLLIDVTLYASFKSLDFGLLLFLVTVWAPDAALHPAGSHSKPMAAHAG